MEYKVGMKVKIAEDGKRYPQNTTVTVVGVSSIDIHLQRADGSSWWFALPITLVPITRITQTKPYNHTGENT